MAYPPRFRALSMEDIPDAPPWLEPLLAQLSGVLGGLVDGVTNRLTRRENMLSAEKLGYEFTTAANTPDTWPLRIRNELPVPPRFVWANLARRDGIRIVPTWSMSWWLNASNELEVTLQGLDASTAYRLSLVYE